MKYNIQTITDNSIKLLYQYCPNLFHFIKDDVIIEFVKRSFIFIEEIEGEKKKRNFISIIIDLASQHKKGYGELLSEFEYFNFLLGEFHNYQPNSIQFGNLLKASILNLNTNDFHNSLAEIAVLLNTITEYEFVKYEYELENGKQIDLVFRNESDKINFYIDVVTIHFNLNDYIDQKDFEKKITTKVRRKYESKTVLLEPKLKNLIYIAPVISGLKDNIVQENLHFLKTFKGIYDPATDIGFNSIQLQFFAKYGNNTFGLIDATTFEKQG
ncbi:hypothetical protein [Patiriisocius sp. Uisw_017]|jgi:hypothetical protein|uniref:hypothetical protein n=1 Tax=Patiriisocius sp. Uisw_017 TaxID=3230968 RepID=UPI0039EBE843